METCTRIGLTAAAGLISLYSAGRVVAASEVPDLPVIRKDVRTGFAHGGWKYDRYKELQSLDAGTSITVADLKGPGIIRHIHTTRHSPRERFARGIVLEIHFDDAEQPAVRCPLADFFGDGCNGHSMYFTSPLIECAPWSYNCYFPMPFKTRARVALRNDTDTNAANYSFVEWEPLPEWRPELGYFHATYQRRTFQLTKDTDVVFFEVEGPGHLIGRQYSVITDEPLFRDFAFVMEGNNEVDIDGQQRALDYLGTEDSFTFSWGFQQTFIGLHAGMPLVKKGPTNLLSIYRFHDHMPIRFHRKLRWHINWKHERMFTANPAWGKAVAGGGCWVDYATVHYWYQDDPGGYQHAPLAPVSQRGRVMSIPAADDRRITAVLKGLPPDKELVNTISTPEQMRHILVRDAYDGTHPLFIDRPEPKGGHPGNPNPGRQGILAVHPRGPHDPCVLMRKVALPAERNLALRVVVSGDPYEAPGKSDVLLQCGVHDGRTMTWLEQEVIDAGSLPSERNWRTLNYPLTAYAGRTVGIVLKVSYGGPKNAALNEEAFFDEISVVRE